MIVQIRLEVTDEQRNALAIINKPTARKRLATRAEVQEFVEGAVAAIGEPESPSPEDVYAAAEVLSAPVDENGNVTVGLHTGDPYPDIEKHGTGIGRVLFHVGNAMCALGSAKRTAANSELHDERARISPLAEQTEELFRDIGGSLT